MKKIIFTLSFATICMMGFSQTPGYSSTGIYDDIVPTEEYGDPNDQGNTPNGIYWSGNDAGPSVCASSILTRNTTAHREEFVLTTASAGCWDPNIFISFQGLNTNPGLNLTNNSTFSFDFKNEGDSILDVYVDIVDDALNAVNVDANGAVFVQMSVAPGQTVPISGDFAGGYKSVDGVVTTGFHFNNVISMEVTAINHNVDNPTDWNPLPLPGNYKVSIGSLKLGTVTGSGVSEIGKSSFAVYPNPTQGNEVTFSQNLNNISLINSLGELMSFTKSSNKLDISNLEAGIYFIKAEQGISKLVIQ